MDLFPNCVVHVQLGLLVVDGLQDTKVPLLLVDRVPGVTFKLSLLSFKFSALFQFFAKFSLELAETRRGMIHHLSGILKVVRVSR